MSDIMNIEKLIPPQYSEDECYKAGFDCAINGADTGNCHFSYFSTRENTKVWEEGKRAGEIKKALDE